MNSHLLREAAHEIRSLRRQNEILRAKVEVMDLFACVLFTKPAENLQPMSPDVAFELERKANEIEATTATQSA